MVHGLQIAVFGSGCFWCTEAVFERLRGVLSVQSGYAGGPSTHSMEAQGRLERGRKATSSGGKPPTYEEVSSGQTGHAEVLRIEYDPAVISYEILLNVFFATPDPTTLNRQGGDVGTQYRSIILYTSEEQRREAESFLDKLEKEKTFEAPVVTEVRPLEKFYEAEAYHQKYYRNNQDKPYCQAVINPKLAKLREKYAKLLKL